MKLSAILAPLVAAKVPHEVILEAVRAYEQEQENALERRRRADADRQARKREREKSRDVTLRHSDRSLVRGRDTRVEDKTSNSEIEPQKKDIRDTPLSRLEVVLDQERARSVVDHRQRIRKPLTERAAKLLADKFARCRDPNAAADAMVSNGWQGFEPEWMDRPTARGSPAVVPMKDTAANAARRRIEAIENARRQSGFGALDDHQPAAGVLSIDFRRTGG